MYKSKLILLAVIIFILVIFPNNSFPQDSLDVALEKLTEQINNYMVEKEKTKIAIIPFSDLQKNETTVLGSYIAEELTTNLFITGKFKIVERSLLKQVLDELKLGQTGVVNPSSAKELGKMAGVDAIVAGTITDLGSYVAINCRLIETESGEVFAAAKAKIKKDENITKIMGYKIETVGTKSVTHAEPEEESTKEKIEEIKSYNNKIQYASFGFDRKAIRIEIGSSRILLDGKIEFNFLITNVLPYNRSIRLLLESREKNNYVADLSGNRYYYISSNPINEDKSITLHQNVPTKVTIIYPIIEKNIDILNLVLDLNNIATLTFSNLKIR